jgi:ubiquinone biosynthesis monooxygenase Coq7
MKYRDSRDSIDTPKKILKVNHAGEFGAINIYRAQIMLAKLFRRDLVPMLESFMADEKRHLDIFWTEIRRRNGLRCKSYWLCGLGGWSMGLISALFGKRGIMACTWAVESVVVNHLNEQLVYLGQRHDKAAFEAVKSILDDEQNHRDIGLNEGGMNRLYAPFRFMISSFTEGVIRFGMR